MALLQRLKTPFAEEAPEGTAVPPGPRSAGDVLQQRREALGLDLADVAAALRIKPAYLAALEAGRPDQLPGPTYAGGFARAYGDHLRLDGIEILRRFKRESAALDKKPDLAFPMPLEEHSIPSGGMLLIATMLAICGYGTWYYLSTGEGSRPERVAEVPAWLLPGALEQRPVEPMVPRSAEAVAAPRVAMPAASTSAAPDATNPQPRSAAAPPAGPGVPPASSASDASVAAAAQPPAAASTAPSPPPQSEEPRAPGVTEGSTRIVIRAAADSWVQIRDASQTVLLTRVLKAGESYSVPDRPGMSMRTGNAGGLEIIVDGSPAPPIGRRGMVRRNVALDPAALATGRAVRE